MFSIHLLIGHGLVGSVVEPQVSLIAGFPDREQAAQQQKRHQNRLNHDADLLKRIVWSSAYLRFSDRK
jgi:hypothetical protein